MIGYLDPIFKIDPAIKPIGGTAAVKVDKEAFKKSKRGVASLSDLVVLSGEKNRVEDDD